MRIPSCCVAALLLGAPLAAQDDVAALTKQLREPDMGARLAAATKLGALGTKAAKAAPQLAKALTDKEKPVADAAARALAKTGKPALPLIRAGLGEADSVRGAIVAAGALGAAGAEFVPAILDAFPQFADTEGLPEAARGAAKAIGASAVPALTAALKKRAVSDHAAQMLRVLGPIAEPAVPELMVLVVDRGDLSSRLQAAGAVGAVGKAARKHVPALLEVALDEKEDAKIRGAALRAIGEVGSLDPAVAERIQTLLKSEDERLATSAKDVIEQLKKSKP